MAETTTTTQNGFDWQSLISGVNDTLGIAGNFYATSQGQQGAYSPTPGIGSGGGGVIYMPTPAPTAQPTPNNTILYVVIGFVLLLVLGATIYLITQKK